MDREPTTVQKDTHDRPRDAVNLRPAGAPVAELLEAQPPSSAHARADNFIGVVPKHQPLFDALNPGLHGGVRVVGQTHGTAGRDTPTRLGAHGVRSARSDTLHGGGRNTHARRPKAGARPKVGAVETGSLFGVTAKTASLSPRFAALHRRFLITPTARLEPPPVSTPRSRALLVTPKWIRSSISPLQSEVSVSTSEQQVVDLGEMTTLCLSQTNVMISAAATISLITAVWRPTAHCARPCTF